MSGSFHDLALAALECLADTGLQTIFSWFGLRIGRLVKVESPKECTS